MARLKHFANTRLDEQTYGALKTIVCREDRSISYILRRAAIEYVKKYELASDTQGQHSVALGEVGGDGD